MKCAQCGSLDDKVIDSRVSKDGNSIRRRRACVACGHRFTTYEVVERRGLDVVKRDKTRQLFDKEKLLGSLRKACEKRPVSRRALEEAVEEIITRLEQEFQDEVPSTRIGLEVMSQLQSLDPVAYVRYASVYRSFEDVGEFIDEIRNLRTVPGVRKHPELFIKASP